MTKEILVSPSQIYDNPTIQRIYSADDPNIKKQLCWAFSETTVNIAQQQYQSAAAEFEQITHQTQPDPGTWIINTRTQEITKVLPQKAYLKVLQSRAYPIFSHRELEVLSQSKGAFIGLSTGLSVLTGLSQLGLMDAEGFDPDDISVSNLQRLIGCSIHDIGLSKAQRAAEIALGINPHAKVIMHHAPATPSNIQKLLTEKDFIVDMVDSAVLKTQLRETQKQLHQQGIKTATIFMGTNTENRPVITAEQPDSLLFIHGLSQTQLDTLHAENPNPYEFMQAVIDIVGEQNIPLRQWLNFILNVKGKTNYLAQHGANAMLAAGGTIRLIIPYLSGKRIPSEMAIDLNQPLSRQSIQQSNSDFLHELQTEHRDIPEFSSAASLEAAVSSLVNTIFHRTINFV